MTPRQTELQELEAVYRLKYGFISNPKRKSIAEEILHAYRTITDSEVEQVAELTDGNLYKALHKLVVMELLGIKP